MQDPRDPFAEQFRERLNALLCEYIDRAAQADGERGGRAYAALLGTLFATACDGVAESGIPLDQAVGVLAKHYGADLQGIEVIELSALRGDS